MTLENRSPIIIKCEKGVTKEDSRACFGPFCQPDIINAARIAQNFTKQELDEKIAKVGEQLDQEPQSCRVQAGLNQLMKAAELKRMPPA